MRLRRRWRGAGAWGRALTWIVVGAVGLAVAAEVALHRIVDADFVVRRLADRLPSRFEVSLGSASFSFLRGSLDLRDLELRRVAPGSGPAVPRLAVPAAHLGGLDRLGLLRGEPWRLGEVRVDSPRVVLRLHALTRSVRERGRDVPPRGRAGRALPPLEVGRLRAADATVVLTRDDGAPIDSARGLDADLRGVNTTDVLFGRGGGPALSVGGADLRLPSLRVEASGGTRVLRLEGLSLSSADSTLRVDRLEWGPPGAGGGADDAPADGGPDDGVRVTAAGVAARHVDFGGLVARHALAAGLLGADSLEVRASERRGTGGADTAAAPPALPDAWLARVHVPLALDTVRVRHGSVVYEETPAGSPRAGRVSFVGVEARLLDLANAAGAAGGRGPASFSASARLEGRAPLALEGSAALRGDSMDLRLSGGVGGMPAAALDSALAPLAGFRFEAGTIDTVAFDLRLRGGNASGTVEARYHGLSPREADAGSSSPDLLDRIGTAILRRRIREDNPAAEGREARVGRVEHTRAPDESFWAYVWKSLRSGLLDVAVR